ncbi:MAG: dihydrofolate reductase [Halieaceae bacterium]
MIDLALIVAVAENGVIGRDNGLPWYLPDDLKYFKRVTMGKPILMGRKTFESIGRPLPGRTNIVISANPNYKADGVRVVSSLEEALARAQDIAMIDGAEELMVIGGAQIYAAALPRAARVYLTEVHAEVAGDAFLPPLDLQLWQEISRNYHPGALPEQYAHSFVVYEKLEFSDG